MDIPDEIRDDLESRAHVVGTARGPNRISGQAADEEVLVVLVDRKLPESQLDEDDLIPPEIEIDGHWVQTDVQEVGDVRFQATATQPAQEKDRERRWRPAPAGVSLGHPDISAGTLGSPVLETADGETVVLTNAHVAAPVDAGEIGDAIYQPGPSDGGTEDDEIGTLADYSEIVSDEPNETDSALVAVDPADVTNRVLGIGEFAGFTEPRAGATYAKSGRTTGVTTGELRNRDARIRVRGYHDEPTVFTGVDIFGPMSSAGDSGSLIGIEDGGFRATHLLFAGSDRATIGIPIEAVEDEHGELAPSEDVSDGGGDGDRSFADAVRARLESAYGDDAVTAGGDVDFRVETAVSLVVGVASGDAELADAAGRALAAADSGTLPVLAYPAGIDTPDLERLGNRVGLLAVESP